MAYYWTELTGKDREFDTLIGARSYVAHRLVRINDQREMLKGEERKGQVRIYKHTNKGDKIEGYLDYEIYSYMSPWFTYAGRPMDINGKYIH